jgi:type II secretory pathway component GspD/PulD (secretin)
MKKLCFALILIINISGCATWQKQEIIKDDFKKEVSRIISKNLQSAKSKTVQDSASSQHSSRFGVVHLRDIALDDFIRVVYTEIMHLPYVLSRDSDLSNRRVDVEIPKNASKANFYSVVTSILEKSGLDIEDVSGVSVISALIQSGSKTQGGTDTNRREAVKPPVDCVYTFQPVYSRAVDLQKTLSTFPLSEGSKIIVNDQTNKLIFKTTTKERRSMLSLMRDLDEKQKQIAVDVTFAEVSLQSDFAMGLEGFLHSAILSLDVSGVSPLDYGGAGSVFVGDWVKSVFTLGERVGLIKITSNPFLLIADGSESTLSVGAEYPILTNQTTALTSGSVTNQIEYRKTGILLSVRPVISGGSVHLQTSIEMSEGQKNASSTIESPTILSRKIKSDVLLNSGDSLIVGGLISEKQNKTTSFLPIGWGKALNLSRADSQTRTEIVVLLNVRILKDSDYEAWFSVLSRKFKSQEVGKL